MIAIHRPSAGRFRAVARKCVISRARGASPPVIVDQTEAGVGLFCHFGEVALLLKQPGKGGSPCRVAVPGSLLEEIENSAGGVANADGDAARCVWDCSGAPRESSWTPLSLADEAGPWNVPKGMKPVDHSIVEALFECGRSTSRESIRFALSRLQVQGKTGQVAGTDGRQLLIWKGFDFPFDDSVLIPAVPVFGCRELLTEADVRIGKTERHLVLTAGPWTIWLAIDGTGRFPDVASVIPRGVASELHLDESNRKTALMFVKHATKNGDDPATITVELGDRPALRAKSDSTNGSSEVLLSHSHCTGDAVMFVLNRDQLARALSLGVLTVSTPSANGPVVFRDNCRTYLATTLPAAFALPANRSSTALSVRSKSPVALSQGVQFMPSESNGRAAADSSSEDATDFMSEAEALRDALGEVGRRAARLVNSLKQLQKQRRVLETAWSSLKNLRLGS